MLALNSRQLSLLLFVVCQNHICSCHYRAPNNGRGLNIGGAWRIIMLRLTLARAVAWAPSINARAHTPSRPQIKLPGTRFLKAENHYNDYEEQRAMYRVGTDSSESWTVNSFKTHKGKAENNSGSPNERVAADRRH
ncbi:uncharacterized protein LOC106097917 isoform X3 [Oreochromis niloticus]|uniref:uncharacterized protein LOC106097917 isoform X3 n=1 Tax=Oreochromis niloticus TaxID=8128 RepID=UPI0009050425|nr:uncharacterized protein LOC106097917 isoform X3 [Oreochromis niloticus]